jgi:hypothetical protein
LWRIHHYDEPIISSLLLLLLLLLLFSFINNQTFSTELSSNHSLKVNWIEQLPVGRYSLFITTSIDRALAVYPINYSYTYHFKLLVIKFWGLGPNHNFWVHWKIVMLNIRKIASRPTCSIFVITQNLKLIFKSNQRH